ncbi:MAG: prepilin-type N-terminal cleavage/methylation domain-containing protein [Desulfobacteraceae bacterium]|nr:prepilin-type N-terminal cleavage/methylation domain-containing protein [Desulfobacteraceae bacterium]
MKNVYRILFGKRKNKGFLLFEIMISVSIMALVFVALSRVQTSSIDLAAKSKFKNIAPTLAKIQLSNIEENLADWSEFSGDFGDDFKGYSWEVTLVDSDFEEDGIIREENYQRFKKIDLVILHDKGQRAYKISTWRVVDEQER